MDTEHVNKGKYLKIKRFDWMWSHVISVENVAVSDTMFIFQVHDTD